MRVSVFRSRVCRQRLGGGVCRRRPRGRRRRRQCRTRSRRSTKDAARSSSRGSASCCSRASRSGRLRATTSTEDAVNVDRPVARVRRHAEPQERQPRPDVSDARLRGDRRRCSATRPTITSSSSAARCCRARRTAPSFRRSRRRRARSTARASASRSTPSSCARARRSRTSAQPPLTLVGHNHAADAAPTKALYQDIEAPLVGTSIRVAEMMKYTSNAWHAVKVVFANEIGNLCKRVGVDSHEVMDIFCQDDKLNLSPYYLKPGFAFGGSCLPKDVRALQYRAKEVDLEMPLINVGARAATACRCSRRSTGSSKPARRRSGCSGSASRRAPTTCASRRWSSWPRRCSARATQLSIYDRNVSLARLVGANKQYIDEQIPHLSRHLCESIDEVIDRVRGHRHRQRRRRSSPRPSTRCRPDQIVIDLVRIPLDFSQVAGAVRRDLLVGAVSSEFFLTWWGPSSLARSTPRWCSSCRLALTRSSSTSRPGRAVSSGSIRSWPRPDRSPVRR